MSWMFANITYQKMNFNQDLSKWVVDKVRFCGGFSYLNDNFKLPKPNFTICDPSYGG